MIVQEEGLRGGQNPVPRGQLLGGNVRARNAQRDDLTSQQRQNEPPCPYAHEAPPGAAAQGSDGGIVDLWANNNLITGTGLRLLGDRLFIIVR